MLIFTCTLLIAGGCSKELREEAGPPATGIEVKVRFAGVEISSPANVLPGSSAAGAVMARYSLLPAAWDRSADSAAEDAFKVTLSEPAPGMSDSLGASEEGTSGNAMQTKGAMDAAATRADMTFENVWVFQFDDSGKALRCANTGPLKVGDELEVLLNSGKGYTIGIVANGPAEGLSITNVPDLATFREGLVFKDAVRSAEDIPLGGTLENVLVLDNGQVQVGSSMTTKPVITLKRILAEVSVALDYQVDGYTFDGIELYSVPAGAGYGVAEDKTDFPSATQDNFAYVDNASTGLAPHKTAGTVYTWYIGDNRRGTGSDITTPQDKNAAKAPQYATYARVKTHYTDDPDAVLYYDVYLGRDMRTDFNVMGNHTYTYHTRIKGEAHDQFNLLGVDGRVSGVSPHSISGATVTPDEGLPQLDEGIPLEGGDYIVELQGQIAEPVEVRAIDIGTKEVLISETAPVSAAKTILKVPAVAEYDGPRTVDFEYKSPKNEWLSITSATQNGYYVNATHDIPSSISTTGGTFHLTISGKVPNDRLKISVLRGGTAVVQQTLIVGESTTYDIDIPSASSWKTQTVTVMYEWRSMNIQIGQTSQQYGAQPAGTSDKGTYYEDLNWKGQAADIAPPYPSYATFDIRCADQIIYPGSFVQTDVTYLSYLALYNIGAQAQRYVENDKGQIKARGSGVAYAVYQNGRQTKTGTLTGSWQSFDVNWVYLVYKCRYRK